MNLIECFWNIQRLNGDDGHVNVALNIHAA